MIPRGHIALSGVCALFAACAFPEFEFEDDDGSGGEASTTANGGGSSTTGGGQGGEAMTPCDLYDDGCPDGQKCSVLDEDLGVDGGTFCVEMPQPANIHPVWSSCTRHDECEAGTLCDVNRKVCRPICQGAADCSDTGGECIPAPKKSDGTIPGVSFCTANCHPQTGEPCSQAWDHTTCSYLSDEMRTDCGLSQNLPYREPCSKRFDCTVGTLCIDDPNQGFFCGKICEDSSDCSPFDNYCTTPNFFHDGTEYGVCLY